MSNYVDTLNPTQKKNMQILIDRMNAKGITNPNAQAGLLAVVSKESEFIPKTESTYKNTSNDRIKSIFKTKLGSKTDAEINKLKADDVAFFNAVYGGMYGNSAYEDGYKYRGRGFNQITFKDAYKRFGNAIGVDLVNNPDKLNDTAVAADALIEYFKAQFGSSGGKLSQYNSTGINDFKTPQDSVAAFYHANAGWKTNVASDPTGGKAKATGRTNSFFDYVKQYSTAAVDVAKKKPLMTLAIAALVTVSAYIIYKQIKKRAQ